jgi:hypothetical protein
MRDGSVRILMHDQMAARDMANKAGGVYVIRTENKNFNINASVVAAEQTTPDALLAAYNQSRVVNP